MGELLTYVSRLEKLFLILAKKCCIDRLRELASEIGSKQVERQSILHPCPFLWTFMSSVIGRCLPHAGRSFLLQITLWKGSPLGTPCSLLFQLIPDPLDLSINQDHHRSQASHEVEASDYQSAHEGPGLRRKSNYHLTEIGTDPKGVQTGHPLHFSQSTDVCANKMVASLQH